MNGIVAYLKTNWFLIFLLIFVVLVRIPVLFDQMIPFQFDHGKDAIGVWHMKQTLSPKLIGPWTSIPGLFFGPAWYYLLLPGAVISGGAPIASVITMLVLGLVTMVVVYTYFGAVEAVLFATSSMLYTITTSAWNPFPMVCLTFILLALLKEVEQRKQLTLKIAAFLGFFSALGFHFSTAFAIFFPVLILLSILIKRIKWSWNQLLLALTAFVIPFIPQLLFEVRHQFIQTKSVLEYLQEGDSDPASLQKITTILKVTAGELKEVIFPAAHFSLSIFNTFLFFLFLTLFLIALFSFFRKKKSQNLYLWVDATLWFALSVLAFTFLHFNIWYLLPLITFSFVLFGQVLKSAPKQLLYLYLGLCFVVSLSKVVFYIVEDRTNLLTSPGFLPNKVNAIEYVYQQAGDRPFASYHFMPDIYDYPYQYLYIVSAEKYGRLPTDFSYKPRETTYIPEKQDLLRKLQAQQDSRSPELIFYIVDKSDQPEREERWWSEQAYDQIIAQHQVSEGITIYTATPEKNSANMSNPDEVLVE